MLYIDREPLVSLLMECLSPETRLGTHSRTGRIDRLGQGQTATRGSNHSFCTRVPQSASSDNLAFKELQQNHEKLQQKLNEESRKHKEQMRHNTVVMMEIQDTINELQPNPRVSHYVYKAGLREECQNYEASCQRREIRYKQIQENVKKSKSLDENVFEILDKMEALQNKRDKRWAYKMNDMGSERMRLANLLMETLDSIEQESGIFLIKPMYSTRGN